MIKDRIQIRKLRRRLTFSYVIIFLLLIWLKNKFDDESFEYDQNFILEIEIIEKEDSIRKLQNQLNNQNQTKPILEKTERKKIINTDKVIEKEEIVDSSKKDNQEVIKLITDTLQNQ